MKQVIVEFIGELIAWIILLSALGGAVLLAGIIARGMRWTFQ